MFDEAWGKYNHLPREERIRRIREESDRISEQEEKDKKDLWNMKAAKVFWGDYD